MIGIFVNLWNRISGSVSYLLDEFSGAAAAFSLRKLSTTYGGSAIRVRRASDNTEQDIGFLGQDLDEPSLMNFVGYQNLFTSSQTAIGSVVNTTSSNNVTTSPNGTNTAIGILENAATDVHLYYNDLTGITIGSSYTYSVYVKGNGRGIRVAGNVGFLSTNVIIDENGNVLSGEGNYSVVSVGSGWFRVSLTQVATATTIRILVYSMIGTNTTFLGDVTKGIYLWGFQLNVGTTAQPYQVTTSAARSGDGFVTKWYTQDSNWENLLLQSQTFEHGYWVKVQSSVSTNVTTAPDGTLTAEKVIDTTANNVHYVVSNTVSITGSSIYTCSFYVKAAEITTGAASLYSDIAPYDSNLGISFNLTTGTIFSITSGAAVLLSSGISNVGNDWYRIWVTGITNRTNIHRFNISLGTDAYIGTGTQGFFIWGAQLSQSSWLQPYQVTTTAAILRRDASQSTAANQPRIVGGGVVVKDNGKPSMFFDGVNDHFVGTDIALPVWSIFGTAVRNVNNVDGVHTIYSRGSSTDASRDALMAFVDSTKTMNAQRRDGVNTITSNAYNAISNYLLASGIYTGSQITAFTDSIAASTIVGSVTGSVNPVTLIGATGQNASTAFYMGGEIGEVIVYNSDRTSTRANIERNIGAYYQTQWTGASTGLLDQFGGAAAAYSLRNLSSSYRGPLIRVRRSSDNAETDIGGTYSGDLDVASLLSFTGGQNLFTNSEDFSAIAWEKYGVGIVTNTTIAPNGTLTSDSINETAGGTIHSTYQPVTLSSNSQMTGSVYLKAKERRYAFVSITTGAGATIRNNVIVDLQEGVIVKSSILSSASGVYSSISNAGNGWWRISVSIAATTTAALANYFGFGPTDSANPTVNSATLDPVYNGVAGSGIYIWGAQLNTGILQPYIPTTTAAVNGANAFVTKWYDQSGLTRDAIQATAASQPRIVNSGGVESEGNRPALFFDGIDDTLATSNAVITSNNFSTFAAFASSAGGGSNLITQHTGSLDANRTVFIGSSSPSIGSAFVAYNDGTNGYSATTTSTQPFDGTGSIVYSDTNGSGLTTIGFNGVQDGSVNGTVWIPLNTPLRIGSVGPTSPTGFLVGRISETFLYNSRQTNPRLISSNINSYYQIYWQGNGTALLDNYSGASAAYSLRNLSSAYTGPLIRVRRSNDNVERDIFGTFGGDLDIASLVAFVGANSGFVTTWYDQSGSARHAGQTTAANQPRIVNAGVVDTTNGKPSLFFDGAGDALANSGVTSSNWTMLAVVNIGAPNYGGIYGADASDNAFMYNKLAGGYGWRANGNYNGLFNFVSGTQSLFLDINGSLGSMYVNGSAGSVNQPLNGTSSVTFTRVFGNWAGLTYSGNAQELVVYNSSLPSIRTGTQSNINNYYKIY